MMKMTVPSPRRPWLTHRLIAILVLTALCAAVTLPTPVWGAKRIAIVYIDQDPSTQRTIKGVMKAFDRSGVQATYQESLLRGHEQSDAATLDTLRAFDSDLFITIGSYATLTISEAFPAKPIIFATVMNPKASGFIASMNRPGGSITGAALDIPCDIQFEYFKRVVGKIRKMGVIYSSETQHIIEEAGPAAAASGIRLVPIKIQSEKDIPQAIDSLCKVSDVLWSVADHTVYSPQSTRHIILQTLRYRIPMMAFSQALVEAGGLFTLDFDFKDIGRQAGEIAVRVLRGTPPGDIPVTTPGVIYFKYNEKTADQLSLQIPEDLLAVAKEVVK